MSWAGSSCWWLSARFHLDPDGPSDPVAQPLARRGGDGNVCSETGQDHPCLLPGAGSWTVTCTREWARTSTVTPPRCPVSGPVPARWCQDPLISLPPKARGPCAWFPLMKRTSVGLRGSLLLRSPPDRCSRRRVLSGRASPGSACTDRRPSGERAGSPSGTGCWALGFPSVTRLCSAGLAGTEPAGCLS